MIEGGKAPCDEGFALGGETGAPCREKARPWVLATTILGSSLAFLSGSVVNVALPAIQRDQDASAPDLQWVMNAYLLLLSALVLPAGSAGDRFGRRRVFMWGVSLFLASSVACALAPSVGWLIACRALQGCGAALLVPASLALISANFPEKIRGGAIGTWASFSALTTAFGPLLGGALVDAASWRWCFAVVVPPAVAALVLAWRFVPESRRASPAPLDLGGAAAATLALALLTYGLIAAAARGFGETRVVAALAGAVLIGALFLVIQRRHPDPMLPLALFRSPTFSGANLMTLLLYFALGGAFFFLPFNLVQVQGYSATEAGAAFLPFTLVMGLLGRVTGQLADRIGYRPPLVVGPLVAGLAFALLARADLDASYWVSLLPAMLVLGIGMAAAVAPLTTVVMNAVEEGREGAASGVNNAVARVAGLLAVAVLGLVVLGVFSRELARRLEDAQAPAAAKETVWRARNDLAAIEVPDEVGPEPRRTLEAAVRRSFLGGYRVAMWVAAAAAAASAVSAFWLVRPAASDGKSGSGVVQPDPDRDGA